MKYVIKYEKFSVNETMDMFTLSVDPIPGMKDVMSDIGDFISNTGEFIWEKLTAFMSWIKDKLKDCKEFFSQLFEAIGEMSKIQLNKITNLFFSKDYHDVEWSDLSIKNVKELGSKVSSGISEFFTDKSWSFSDDEDKLKSKEGLEDKSLKLKSVLNKILNFLGKTVITSIISKLIVSVLVSIGLSGAVAATVASIIILISFIWLSKKRVNTEIKVMKDVRDVPGYNPKSFFGRIFGWEDFTKSKIKEFEDFTQGDSPFQRMYRQRLKEQSDRIKKEPLEFA